MKRRLLAGLVPAVLALLSGPVQADIYAFVDSNGVRHLSNVPNDPRYKLVMRTPAYSKSSAQSASSFAPSNLYSPGVASLMPRNYTPPPGSVRRLSRVNEANRQRFTPDINRIANQHRLDPALMHAVISAESAYNPWAVSPKGAMGLMQLMPGTAERFGVNNPYDPIANMNGGARYLRWLLNKFNDPRLAVAAYNAGEGAVQKYGNQIPPYKETQTYVVRVMGYYQQHRANNPYSASYNTVAYNAAQSSATGNRGVYRPSPGVIVITPRSGKRPASLTNVPAASKATQLPRTYLRPTGDRVIVGNSNPGNRRPVVKYTQPTRAIAPARNTFFAGNDK